MDEAIPAQYEVGSGQIVSRNVGVTKEPPAIFVFGLVFGYQFRNDVYPEISLDREVAFFHPIEVPASGVQQESCAQFSQEIRKLIAKRSRTGHA